MKTLRIFIRTTFFLIIYLTISLKYTFSQSNCKFSFRYSPMDTDNKNETSVSTSSYFLPQTQRNPFLSPMDYEKIKKIEEEKKKKEELLKQLAEQQEKPKKLKKKDEDNFLKNIKLQGIVGKYAIINGDMVEEGKYYKKKILIEKVYSDYVIINYKGKKYKLIIK